jgi:hypothetical protein
VLSLTRVWVCFLQLLLVLAIVVILGSESRGTRDHILLSQFQDSPNLEGQVPVFISPQEQGGPVIPPGTGFPFRLPPMTCRDTVEIFEPASIPLKIIILQLNREHLSQQLSSSVVMENLIIGYLGIG